jgi:cytochrome c oxidase assembly protein subunit 15
MPLFFNSTKQMVPKSEKRFIRLNLVAILVTLLVILAGGVVRSTGSGMGCPDWPKCFDQYIPPTSASQLPADYKEKFVEHRVAKNERFARLLDKMGKNDLADSIRHDESILEPEVFNVSKTWTEYINRLVGAVTGFVLLALVVYSYPYRKTAKRIFVLSIVNVFMVVFQAWLGSIVVSTNLMAWIVTVHMLFALVILAILIYTYFYAVKMHGTLKVSITGRQLLLTLVISTIVLSIIQIILGTEVREKIDEISKALDNNKRDIWISKVGDMFVYHRDLAIAVAVVNAIFYKFLKDKFSFGSEEVQIGNFIVIVLVIQIASGLLLSNFALPPYAQAIHILFATVLFSLQYYLYLLLNKTSPLIEGR